MDSPSGTILHLQRLSTEDGPGIRTTVFLKGCPLKCAWCHNPESIPRQVQIQWLENRCIGCHTCLESCQWNALLLTDDGLRRDRDKCQVCGQCVEDCPAGAMQLLGQEVSPETLCGELLKDRAFFEKSGGGVTLSGGEPTLQPAFSLALCQLLQAVGVQVAVDTCGSCTWDTLRSFIPYTAVFLYDLKFIDESEHRQWTGAPNQRILDNLKQLGAEGATARRHLWIRTPLIPGATLSQKNISAIGAWLGKEMDGRVERWELCAFNNLGRDKYRRLDLDWEFASAQTLSADQVSAAQHWAVTSGVNPDLVSITGAVKNQ